MNPLSSRAAVASAVALLVHGAPAAVAAPDDTGGAGPDSRPIEEIVVTARRRTENLQQVPISITAMSGSELEARQVHAMDQLGAVVPNLQFDKAAPSSGSSSVGQIFIRGIGQSDYTPVTDPGVALYVDGIYLGRSPGNVLDLIDVERVEVLRGPQGTLFGRNSIGGAIKVHSRLPEFTETAGRVGLRLGNDNLTDLTFRGNLPLSDALAAGVALGRLQRDGYVERPFDGLRTGDRDRWSARGAVRWEPTDALAASLVVDYTTIDENGAPVLSGGVNDRQPFATFGNAVLASCDAVVINPAFDGTPESGPPTFPPPGAVTGNAPGCYGADSAPGPFVSEGTFPVASELDSGGAALTVDWSLDDRWGVRSTTGYREMTLFSSRDGDNTPANIFATRDDFEHEQFSQELQLRFAGEDDGLSAVLGLFYYDESGFNLVDVTVPTGAIQSGGYYDNRSWAVFAHGTLDLTGRLALSVGARHTEDRKAYLPDQLSLGDASAGSAPGFFPPTWPELAGFYLAPTGPLAAGERILHLRESELDFDATDTTIDLSYRFSDGVLGYVTHATGYKSGGFDQRFVGPTPDRAPSSYRPETVDSLEAGVKASSPGGRLRVNVSVFDADYEDLQIIVRESFNPLTVNAGAARVRGGELELEWFPADDWEIGFAAGRLHTEYRQLNQPAQDSGVRLDNALPNSPAWTLAAGTSRRLGLGRLGEATARVDWSWQDTEYHDAVNSPQIRQSAFHLVSASLAYVPAGGRWEITVAARNLLDETYLVTGNSAFDTAAAYVEQVYGRPRELLVSVGYEF
ncbi:TonB-dependent receptor [Lentisalinibacter orientalis]|uniref:TonB-dependent receptor n=1 Tax=Lentisalinibacter orientalis TaxID=2992241 RepID=UPI0038700D78